MTVTDTIILRIIEKTLRHDIPGTLRYVKELRDAKFPDSQFDAETFEDMVISYFNPAQGKWATQDDRNRDTPSTSGDSEEA